MKLNSQNTILFLILFLLPQWLPATDFNAATCIKSLTLEENTPQKIELALNPGFNALEFADAIDKTFIVTKSGEKLMISAELGRNNSTNVDIQIWNADGVLVASGNRTVDHGFLGNGSFFISKDWVKLNIQEQYERSISFETYRKPVLSDFTYRVDIDPRSGEISQIRIVDRFQGQVGQIFKTENDWSLEIDSDLNTQNILHKFVNETFPEIVKRTTTDPMMQSFIRRYNGMLLDYSNQGIASAVYRKYAEVVPQGTYLRIDANNVETVSYLNDVNRSVQKDRRYLKIKDYNDRQLFIQKQLLEAVSQTKWGRILKHSGWIPVKVEGSLGSPIYYLLWIKGDSNNATKTNEVSSGSFSFRSIFNRFKK